MRSLSTTGPKRLETVLYNGSSKATPADITLPRGQIDGMSPLSGVIESSRFVLWLGLAPPFSQSPP